MGAKTLYLESSEQAREAAELKGQTEALKNQNADLLSRLSGRQGEKDKWFCLSQHAQIKRPSPSLKAGYTLNHSPVMHQVYFFSQYLQQSPQTELVP